MIEIALTALISIIVTGAASWLTMGRKAVSRDDVAEMIRAEAIGSRDAHAVCETHCPYLVDKGSIHQRLDQMQQLVTEVRSDVKQLLSRRSSP